MFQTKHGWPWWKLSGDRGSFPIEINAWKVRAGGHVEIKVGTGGDREWAHCRAEDMDAFAEAWRAFRAESAARDGH